MSQLNPSLIPSPPSQLLSLAGIVIALFVLQVMIAVVKDWEQVLYRIFFLHLSPGPPGGSMSPAILVAATIPSVFAAVLFVLVLFCVYICLRRRLHNKRDKMAAREYDYPEYATVEAHSTSIRTEENIAYETGIQSMDTKPNIAYDTVMQGHSPRTQDHNTSL